MAEYKIQALFQRQEAVKCCLFLTFNKNIHFAWNQSFGQNLASVWKDYLAIRVSGK